ncbi:GGDEF domain-containing protein [Anoxybacterium hadale]|uniref:GGDEF domain-containing protein n=1 Tax=Anoxybacterium hadale TaxID=3408580 RepID=UPI003B00D9C0
MNLLFNLMLNLYSAIILIVMCAHSCRRHDKYSLQQKLFHLMLLLTLLLLFFDTLSRFDGHAQTYYVYFNSIGNFVVFLMGPLPSVVWMAYANYEIYRDERRVKALARVMSLWLALNGLLTLLSLRYHWLYYIDEGNIYHRGPLFLVPAMLTVGSILIAFVMVSQNRKRIEKKHYFSLVFFPVPPLVSILVQIYVYGTSLILNGLTISLLVVFITIQNQRMDTDYLTGVANRKKLEEYLKAKIAGSTAARTFSAILIDLNNFKLINDTYGHETGDQALETAAGLLKSCIRRNDFIARYGGDEFCIIMDISDEEDLIAATENLSRCLDLHNQVSDKPYKISFSMGYSVYDFKTHLTPEAFQKKIDLLMYENKNKQKSRKIKLEA